MKKEKKRVGKKERAGFVKLLMISFAVVVVLILIFSLFYNVAPPVIVPTANILPSVVNLNNDVVLYFKNNNFLLHKMIARFIADNDFESVLTADWRMLRPRNLNQFSQYYLEL